MYEGEESCALSGMGGDVGQKNVVKGNCFVLVLLGSIDEYCESSVSVDRFS